MYAIIWLIWLVRTVLFFFFMSIDAERFFGLICSVSRFCWYGFIWDESPSSAFLYLKIYNPLYQTTCGDNSKSSFLFYSDYGHLFISWYSIDVYQTTFLYFILGTWRLYSINKITHKKSNYLFSWRFMGKVPVLLLQGNPYLFTQFKMFTEQSCPEVPRQWYPCHEIHISLNGFHGEILTCDDMVILWNPYLPVTEALPPKCPDQWYLCQALLSSTEILCI